MDEQEARRILGPRGEAAVARVVAEAPPLRPEQIAHIRAVLKAFRVAEQDEEQEMNR